MENEAIVLQVHCENSRDENVLVNGLMDELNANVRGIRLDRRKEDPDTLDPGTVILAILGTKFALELARTLHSWLMRNQSATLTIGKDGEIHATGVSAANIEKVILEKLRGPRSAE